jgi:hypothetical protein
VQAATAKSGHCNSAVGSSSGARDHTASNDGKPIVFSGPHSLRVLPWSTLCVPLTGSDLAQCTVDSFHFFSDHPNGLLIARKWHGGDSVHGTSNLVISITN